MPAEMKLDLGEILDVLRQRITDEETLKKITSDLLAAQRALAAEKAAEKEENASTGPKNKYRLSILIRGDAALKAQVAGGAYILAVPDGEDAVESNTYMGEALLQRFYKAISHHNDHLKGKRGKSKPRIKTISDAFRILKPKTIKESENLFKVKTDLPVEVIVVEKEEV